MKGTHSFRVGLYLSVCLATFSMWLGEDAPPPYPWIVVLLAIAAFAFADYWQVLLFPPRAVAVAGLGAFALFIGEEVIRFRSDPPDYVMPLGHLFVCFQVIWFFHRKTPRYYGYMIIMSFLQMAIAALHNNGLSFGLLMSTYLVLMIWTLTRFNLVREGERHEERTASHARVPAVSRSLFGSIGAGAAIVLTALAIFLSIPRQGETAWTHSQFRPGQYLSGFDDRIRLGQFGTILESDDEVMSVHLYDETGQPIRPRDEPLWRGVTMAHYEDGRWERRSDLKPPVRSEWLPLEGTTYVRESPPQRFIRQEISLKAVHRDVLFGMRPFFRGTTRGGESLLMSWLDGTLQRPESTGTGPLQYTIESYVESDRPQPRASCAREALTDPLQRSQYLQVPPELRERLRQYVASQNLPQSDGRPDLLAAQFMDHLQDARIFDYTLVDRRVDPTIDPVLDFLVNRKEGHCEYFASALALLLRSHGVPARVVNGFRGGDWNELVGKFMVVRQKHAHSWVEAVLVSPDQPDEPRWVTLDPTPGQSRQRVVAQVNRTPRVWQQFRDMARQLWASYVLNFNAGEQEAAVYGPVRLAVTERVAAAIDFFRQRSEGESGFNWWAALVASGLAALALGVARVAVRLVPRRRSGWTELHDDRSTMPFWARQLRRLFRFWVDASESAQQRVAFYDEFIRVLERHGIHKPATWTPQQFAEHAAAALNQRAHHAAAALIPPAIVDRFYRVRFGRQSLSEPEADDVQGLLAKLADTLAKKE